MDGREIPLIVEVHAEEAAILWLQRDRAVDAPHFNRMFLARLDERLEANLDGLRVAGRAGWDAARKAFDGTPEPGEFFTLAALAFGAASRRGVGEVLEILTEASGERFLRPAISALGWLDPAALRGQVQPLLDDPRPIVRALGLGACTVHRVDPDKQLEAFLGETGDVRREALRLAGTVGRVDLLPLVKTSGTDVHASMAAVLLGDRKSALASLERIAVAPGPERDAAFDMLVLASDPADIRKWLAQDGLRDATALAVRAAGLIGNAELVPWLLRQMEDPETARSAGESFSLLTGADLAYLDLDADAPQEADEGPNDDPGDENVALDPDDDLPWPDAAAVFEWWADNAARFPTDAPLILGRPKSEQTYKTAFTEGYQRQRRAAALGYALLKPGNVLPAWRARMRYQVLREYME